MLPRIWTAAVRVIRVLNMAETLAPRPGRRERPIAHKPLCWHLHHQRPDGRTVAGQNGGMSEGNDSADILALRQTPEAIELRHLRAFVAVPRS